MRKETPALSRPGKENLEVQGFEESRLLYIRRRNADNEVILLYSLGRLSASERIELPGGRWQKDFDSAAERWQGKGSKVSDKLDGPGEVAIALGPWQFVVFVRED